MQDLKINPAILKPGRAESTLYRLDAGPWMIFLRSHAPDKTKPRLLGPGQNKTAPIRRGHEFPTSPEGCEVPNLALTGFETTVGLVDHIDPALAADDPAIAVALFRRF